MRARIHFEWPNGTADSIDLDDESVENIRAQADKELAARNATNPWSEILD